MPKRNDDRTHFEALLASAHANRARLLAGLDPIPYAPPERPKKRKPPRPGARKRPTPAQVAAHEFMCRAKGSRD